ncbi:hypothetical protein C3L33_17815, partial [Rhododendron williamsianum]
MIEEKTTEEVFELEKQDEAEGFQFFIGGSSSCYLLKTRHCFERFATGCSLARLRISILYRRLFFLLPLEDETLFWLSLLYLYLRGAGIASSSTQKSVITNNANPTVTPNHVMPPTRQKSMKKGGGSSSGNANANGLAVPESSPRDHTNKEVDKGEDLGHNPMVVMTTHSNAIRIGGAMAVDPILVVMVLINKLQGPEGPGRWKS